MRRALSWFDLRKKHLGRAVPLSDATGHAAFCAPSLHQPIQEFQQIPTRPETE